MIATLLSLFAAGALTYADLPSASPHTMPWNDQGLLEATAVPQKDPLEIAPVIKAKAAVAVDLDNGLILYEKNIHDPLPIASLTKLMTGVIVLEENGLNETVTVTRNASQTEGSKIWLAPGEKISVESLLYGIFIPSANDAAVALAEHNGGTIAAFVDKMNAKARELGLTDTVFVNPTGLNETHPTQAAQESDSAAGRTNAVAVDSGIAVTQQTQEASVIASDLFGFGTIQPDLYQNFSTAYDLTLLARYAYGKSFIRRAVVKKDLEVTSLDGKTVHKLKNTNELLDSYLKVLGLKTGTTDEAGECLIAVVENDQGHDILTVVLNSPNRYSETKLLADWVFRAYKWN